MVKSKLGLIAAALACAVAGALLLARLRSAPVAEPAFTGPDLAPIASTIVTPLASSGSFTNADLARNLQDETSRLGITGIARPDSGETSSGNGGFMGERLGQPGTREQAEAYIRQLAQMRRPFEREKEKSVKLPGDTAGLLGNREKGGAIEEPAGTEGPKKK